MVVAAEAGVAVAAVVRWFRPVRTSPRLLLVDAAQQPRLPEFPLSRAGDAAEVAVVEEADSVEAQQPARSSNLALT